jgi:hypothetical protein
MEGNALKSSTSNTNVLILPLVSQCNSHNKYYGLSLIYPSTNIVNLDAQIFMTIWS